MKHSTYNFKDCFAILFLERPHTHTLVLHVDMLCQVFSRFFKFDFGLLHKELPEIQKQIAKGKTLLK